MIKLILIQKEQYRHKNILQYSKSEKNVNIIVLKI